MKGSRKQPKPDVCGEAVVRVFKLLLLGVVCSWARFLPTNQKVRSSESRIFTLKTCNSALAQPVDDTDKVSCRMLHRFPGIRTLTFSAKILGGDW